MGILDDAEQCRDVALIDHMHCQGSPTYIHCNLVHKYVHACVYDISTYTMCILEHMCSNIVVYKCDSSVGYIFLIFVIFLITFLLIIYLYLILFLIILLIFIIHCFLTLNKNLFSIGIAL